MDANTIAELMSAATQAPPLDYASLGLPTPPQQPPINNVGTKTEAQIKAEFTHKEWLGHSTTMALIARLELWITKAADIAEYNSISKDYNPTFVQAALAKRSAAKEILELIKTGK